jgi:hypothetical protein
MYVPGESSGNVLSRAVFEVLEDRRLLSLMVETVDEPGAAESEVELVKVTHDGDVIQADLEGVESYLPREEGEVIPEEELIYYTMIDPAAEEDPDAVKRDLEVVDNGEVVGEGVDGEVIITMVPEDGEVIDGEVVITMVPEDGEGSPCPEFDENGDPLYCIATTGGPQAPAPTLVNGVLTVTGTEANDKIRINRASDATKVAVKVNGTKTLFSLSSITSIVVNALAGNDKVQIKRGISIDAAINGGDGNDKLGGGAGDDTIDGGAGNDKLRGGAGDDQLISGTGKDKMRGGKGDDSRNGKKGRKDRGGRIAGISMMPVPDGSDTGDSGEGWLAGGGDGGEDIAIVIDDGSGPMFFPDDSGDWILM